MSAESQIQEARAPLSADSLAPQPACSLPEGETTQSGGAPAASDGPPPSVWWACEHSGSTPASAHVLRPAPLQSCPLWSGPPTPAGLLLAQPALGSRRGSTPVPRAPVWSHQGHPPLGVGAGRGKCSRSLELRWGWGAGNIKCGGSDGLSKARPSTGLTCPPKLKPKATAASWSTGGRFQREVVGIKVPNQSEGGEGVHLRTTPSSGRPFRNHLV